MPSASRQVTAEQTKRKSDREAHGANAECDPDCRARGRSNRDPKPTVTRQRMHRSPPSPLLYVRFLAAYSIMISREYQTSTAACERHVGGGRLRGDPCGSEEGNAAQSRREESRAGTAVAHWASNAPLRTV